MDTSQSVFGPHLASWTICAFFFWFINILIGIGTIVLLVVVIGVIVAQGGKGWLLLPLVVLLIVVDALFDVVAYVAIHLRYDTTWYVMSDRSLRIRRGIWVIQEVTATFENVQNVKISQGPLQRYFGIANLVVETAGGGGSEKPGGGAHRAIIEGISNPDRYREAIMARLRRSSSAGLGDEAEIDEGPAAWTPQHLDVLREIRDEIQGSRRSGAGQGT